MSTTVEGGREEDLARRLEGFASVWQLNCDHEVGEDVGVEGAHGIGEEADVGGGGQQTCVAEVTCVEASDRQVEDVCGTCTSMRQVIRSCGVRAWILAGEVSLVCAYSSSSSVGLTVCSVLQRVALLCSGYSGVG
jgi:hypothetical protein